MRFWLRKEVRKMSNLHFKDKIFQEYLKTPNHELILPSLIIAQGILESNNGKSGLAIEANNLFGVKGKGDAGIRRPQQAVCPAAGGSAHRRPPGADRIHVWPERRI